MAQTCLHSWKLNTQPLSSQSKPPIRLIYCLFANEDENTQTMFKASEMQYELNKRFGVRYKKFSSCPYFVFPLISKIYIHTYMYICWPFCMYQKLSTYLFSSIWTQRSLCTIVHILTITGLRTVVDGVWSTPKAFSYQNGMYKQKREGKCCNWNNRWRNYWSANRWGKDRSSIIVQGGWCPAVVPRNSVGIPGNFM